MGAGSGMRRRSSTMRRSGKMSTGGGANLKICGRIQGIVKTFGSGVNSSGRGIRRHGSSRSIGHVVKPAGVKSEIQKSSSTDSTEGDWIYVRCAESRGLACASPGNMYIPDSEDEEVAPGVAANGPVGVELSTAVATGGAVGVDLALTVAAAEAVGMDVALAVATDGVAGVEMNQMVAGRLAKKVLGEDLHPKVAARLAEVRSEMEPFYHECFIDMYKVMVPLFFTPLP